MLIYDSDDTSVAILEKYDFHNAPPRAASLHFNEKITADNRKFGGIHPLVSLESHQSNLAKLVEKALAHLPIARAEDSEAAVIYRRANDGFTRHRKPDFISVTRGPGVRSSLATGIDMAKGLAVGWQIPIIGVNHMAAHSLTPRLVSAMEREGSIEKEDPTFPFLSLLVSGGHTMIVHSKEVNKHEILASTSDIAIGEMIDKAARLILP